MTLRSLAYIVAGLVTPALWTAVESQLIAWVPVASSALAWRLTQALAGFASALLLVGPLVLAVRPRSRYDGLHFATAFVVFQAVTIEQADDLLLMFRLPDTWVFLLTSIGLIAWASRGRAPSMARA